ncbi:MAG TPA: ATP-binding protein, partial [Chthonomonadales bacterium]|nr:ATP-binding protein [Chthonomonadales bacterium]
QAWGRYVQVLDRHRDAVAYSDALRTTKLPIADDTVLRGLAGVPATFDNVPNPAGYPVRMVTVPVFLHDQIPYLVQVGASVEGVQVALKRASEILLALTPSVFLVALVGGWLLVGRALKPVDDMTRAALTIESKHLKMRLVPSRTDNEIGRLAGALNEMIARLEQSFAQIERFSADASHELKTPLTTIRGEAEVALMSDSTSESSRATFRSIVEETERLSTIVNNLLLLSRADADQVRLKREQVQVHDVVMAAYEPLERLAHRKGVRLDVSQIDEVIVLGDSLWLQQLATNLLHNAINYTPAGGVVTLALIRLENGSGRLTISDTGPGIPEEHLPHIFDRFYRVDSGRSRDQGGTGLGLNIARWIAEAHGGSISVSSVVGQGAQFTVTLPAPLEALPEE